MRADAGLIERAVRTVLLKRDYQRQCVMGAFILYKVRLSCVVSCLRFLRQEPRAVILSPAALKRAPFRAPFLILADGRFSKFLI